MDKRITELVSGIVPENVTLDYEDELLTRRIRDAVMDKAAKNGNAEIRMPDASSTERNDTGMNDKKPKRKLGLTLLIAALVTVLSVGTVMAVAISRMTIRDVSDETVGMHRPTDDGKEYVQWEDASLGFDFTIEGECAEAYFRTGWLPTSESEYSLSEHDADDWTIWARSAESSDNDKWEIMLHHGNSLRDKTFFISGNAEVVKEDSWNEHQRTEVVVHQKNGVKDVNYLLLFSEQHNYLISISGTFALETLEQIADGLEIRAEGTFPKAEVQDPELFESQPLDMEDSTAQDWDEIYETAPQFIFDVTQPCYKTIFRANWLPDESYTANMDDEGYTELLIGQQITDGIPYSVKIYQGDWLFNKTLWFWQMNTEIAVVKEDVYNGMQRIELVMENTNVARQENNILLFSPEGNCLIYIYGTLDMETLENIANGIEIKVTDEVLTVPDRAPAKEQMMGGGLGKG